MSQVDNTVTPDRGPISDRLPWIASMYSNDADTTGNLIVKADPSSGNLYLKHLMIFSDATGVSVTVNDDTTVRIGPFLTTTAEMSHYTDFRFEYPIKFTGALRVDCNTNSPIFVLAEGYTA